MTVGAWPERDVTGAADPSALRVAAVLDEASAAGLRPECELLEIASDTWRQALEEGEPDLLLVESAWAGTSGSWQYLVAAYDHPDSRGLPALRELLGWCRRREVPTVFWSHARPEDAGRFAAAAALFDHVFTSRPEALDAELLPVAVQPRIHNPLSPPDPPSEAPCYAGAYRRERSAGELRALELLLDAARDLGLVIYDPCAGSSDQSVEFPKRFRRHVRGRVPYHRTGAAYKAHRVALVVGGDPTSAALPRAALEAAACGTALVSTSRGLAEAFGELVTIVDDHPGAAGEAIRRLAADSERRARLAIGAQRLALTEHTYRQRLATIARTAGHPVSAEAGREVAALVLVENLRELGRLSSLGEAIAEQSHAPAEVLVGLARGGVLDSDLGPLAREPRTRIRVVRQDRETARAERYGELAAIASSRWVAPLHDSASYGRHHLTDLLARADFARAEVIGTAIRPDGRIATETDRYACAVHSHSALARRDVVAAVGWPDEGGSALERRPAALEQGLRCYGAGGGSFAPEADARETAAAEPPALGTEA